MKLGPMEYFWQPLSSFMQRAVVMCSSVISSLTPHLMSTTWYSSPCFSRQYSLILGYTYSIRVFLSINMSVKVELVKIRTT